MDSITVRRSRFILAGLLLAPFVAHAQTATAVTEYGLHRAVFESPKGKIRVNLPDDAAAGETISGTVYVEPAGKNQRDTDRNGAELSGYVVELEGQKSKTSERHFRWTMPPQLGTGVATVVLRDPKNKIVSRCEVPIDAKAPPPEASGIDMPASGQAGTLNSAWGAFDSNSPATVTIQGQDAPLIAQSPRKIVFQTPPGVSGRTSISVKSGSVSAEAPFYALGLQVTPRGINLLAGQTAVALIQVSGLEDLREPASLAIVNRDPSVVQIEGGIAQMIAIPQASVRPDGTFQIARTLTGVRGGGYDISIVVSRPVSSQMPLERLTDRVVDRWSRQNNVPISPDARSLIASGVFEARAAFGDLLKAQVAYHPDPESLLTALVRDYCFNLRDARLRAIGARPLAGVGRQPPFALGFAPQAAAGASVSISAEDVRSYAFLQYIGQLMARLTPSQAVGELVATSRPNQQLVSIDAVAGPNNYTARTFVVSVGSHRVAIGSCKSEVKVSANERKPVSCPP